MKMIYEIILLDTKKMKVHYAYSREGEVDPEKILVQSGLVSLIETALKQLSNAEPGSSVDLIVKDNAFSFIILGDLALMIRGTNTKENNKIINKLRSQIKEADLEVLKTSLKKIFEENVKKSSSLDEFTSLWG